MKHHYSRSIALCCVPLAGCANLDSIYRPLDVGPNASAVGIDIKQRAIFSTPIKSQSGTNTVQVICSEPSPDALSSYYASGDASLKDDLQLAYAAGEKAASVGLRTQSIQLLRDGLFTDCAAYMNQAISGDKWYQLRRRNQDFTLGLLAIEQLTGTIKAQQFSLDSAPPAAQKPTEEIDKKPSANEDSTKPNADKEKPDKKTSAANSTDAVNEAQKARDDALANLIKFNAALTGLKKPTAEAKQKAQSTVDSSLKDLEAKDVVLTAAKAKNASIPTDEKKKTATAADNQKQSSTGNNADMVGPKINDSVSAAVVQIVKYVLEASGQGETCLELVALGVANPSLKAEERTALATAINSSCPGSEKDQAANVLDKSGNTPLSEEVRKTPRQGSFINPTPTQGSIRILPIPIPSPPAAPAPPAVSPTPPALN